MKDKDFLLETCVLAGKIMLENGAEMFRVEDTMNRIASSFHGEVGISFVTQTIVLMGLESTKDVQIQRIEERTTNLGKVAKVNEYSRKFSSKELTLNQLHNLLLILDKQVSRRPRWLKVISAALLSGSLMILLGGGWHDFIATCFVGAGGYTTYELCNKYLRLKYVDEFVASFVIGVLAFIIMKAGWADIIDNMIIGSIMPLVPGVAITNTVRDLQAGHMLAGISRGVEALMIALMIGAGIAVAFNVMR